MAEDHFARLSLPRRFDLDPAQIEESYLARSRELHPDYHQLSSASEQQASLQLTAALNEAYATLRDPLRRAEHLLALAGGPAASESQEMPPSFLEEMLELRMEIEQIRETATNDSPATAPMEKQLRDRRDALFADVARSLADLQSESEPSQRTPLLQSTRLQLNTIRFVQGLLRDLRAD